MVETSRRVTDDSIWFIVPLVGPWASPRVLGVLVPEELGGRALAALGGRGGVALPLGGDWRRPSTTLLLALGGASRGVDAVAYGAPACVSGWLCALPVRWDALPRNRCIDAGVATDGRCERGEWLRWCRHIFGA